MSGKTKANRFASCKDLINKGIIECGDSKNLRVEDHLVGPPTPPKNQIPVDRMDFPTEFLSLLSKVEIWRSSVETSVSNGEDDEEEDEEDMGGGTYQQFHKAYQFRFPPPSNGSEKNNNNKTIVVGVVIEYQEFTQQYESVDVTAFCQRGGGGGKQEEEGGGGDDGGAEEEKQPEENEEESQSEAEIKILFTCHGGEGGNRDDEKFNEEEMEDLIKGSLQLEETTVTQFVAGLFCKIFSQDNQDNDSSISIETAKYSLGFQQLEEVGSAVEYILENLKHPPNKKQKNSKGSSVEEAIEID